MICDICRRLRYEISKRYIGSKHDIDALITALLTGGHVLIEGMPGLAKTTLAESLANSVNAKFKRVQFTADLMPADITGSSIYNIHSGEFKFIEGPIFTNILLADELNRAPARTQSALLEAMQENQVTVDGVTHSLARPFFVIATQNSEDERGTYPLPLSQLDRFMFRIRLGYPTAAQEEAILTLSSHLCKKIEPVLSPDDFSNIYEMIETIHVAQPVVRYISDIIRATRTYPGVEYGASPRAGVMLLNAARGCALSAMRDYVSPDDVLRMASYVLNHRIVPKQYASDVDKIIDDILSDIKFE